MGFRGVILAFLMLTGAHSSLAQPAVINISVNMTNASEGYPQFDSEPPVLFNINRAGNINAPLSVNLLLGGTASNNFDYVQLPKQVFFPPGVTERLITNYWREDALVESNETLEISIAPGLNYIAGARSNAVVALLDNDHPNYGLLAGQVFDTFVDSAGSQRKVMLDLYSPRGTNAPTPLVIWIFGGAWRGGNRTSVPTPVMELLTNGYSVAAIDYRLSGVSKWPSQVQDVRTAVRWLRLNAGRFGLDPNRFALWGASSGGHLALMGGFSPGRNTFTLNDQTVSLAGRSHLTVPDHVQAIVSWFPPTDFLAMDHFESNFDHNSTESPESALIGSALQTNAALSSTANPILYVHSNTPPGLIMHGTTDQLVPHNQSELLYAQLHRFQRSAVFWPQVNLGHGGAGWADPARSAVIRTFLNRTLRGAATNIPPTPDIRVQVTNSSANAAIGFDGSRSLDRDGSILAYYWSFGDGAGSTNSITSHTYTRQGNYFATLCVLDDRFNVASTGTWITITNIPPATGTPPKIQLIPATFTNQPSAYYYRAEVTPGAAPIDVVQFFINGTYTAQDFTPPYGFSAPFSQTARITAKVIDTNGRVATTEILRPQTP